MQCQFYYSAYCQVSLHSTQKQKQGFQSALAVLYHKKPNYAFYIVSRADLWYSLVSCWSWHNYHTQTFLQKHVAQGSTPDGKRAHPAAGVKNHPRLLLCPPACCQSHRHSAGLQASALCSLAGFPARQGEHSEKQGTKYISSLNYQNLGRQTLWCTSSLVGDVAVHLQVWLANDREKYCSIFRGLCFSNTFLLCSTYLKRSYFK